MKNYLTTYVIFYYVINERDYVLTCRWKYPGRTNKIFLKWVNEHLAPSHLVLLSNQKSLDERNIGGDKLERHFVYCRSSS